ncbi:MAG: 4Fe-4S dicluster domain-containing protein [Acidobacteria bacterium]|jgi:ferredoxin|nr:4Fe-4S dicluster domain-containing protein [Acidobacteriota bacterium]
MQPGDSVVIERVVLDALLAALRERGYETVGPTVREGAIVYDEIRATSDLPAGWTDEQEGGHYRLRRDDREALFGYAVGPHSWRRYLEPPSLVRWRGRRVDGGFEDDLTPGPPPRYAFVGVRPCELAALLVKDRILLGDPGADPDYRSRRESAFLVAVNCGSPAGTCFCVSMGTGPRFGPGFDLGLTELVDDARHDFVLQVGTARGAAVVEGLPHRPAEPADLTAAEAVLREAEGRMGRSLETEGLKERLERSYENPHWDEVAKRCLSCGNCTMVCPTCFCSTVEDSTDLPGTRAERRRIWDSCFSIEFSYVHGGSVRTSAGARYRQWITHKLATWHDQFGVSGCVGCGRCITWCPVGIDITAEARAIGGPAEAAGSRP